MLPDTPSGEKVSVVLPGVFSSTFLSFLYGIISFYFIYFLKKNVRPFISLIVVRECQ